MNIAEEIRYCATGVATLTDWLGNDGNPVSQNVAEARAAVCLHCPNNRPSKWWEIFFKDPIAKAIKSELETKNLMELEVSCEEKLGMCDKCGCCLRLKVWVPIKHIEGNMPPDDLAKLPYNACWIRSEIETQ